MGEKHRSMLCWQNVLKKYEKEFHWEGREAVTERRRRSRFRRKDGRKERFISLIMLTVKLNLAQGHRGKSPLRKAGIFRNDTAR